jgi:hypothetical protein
MVAYMDAARTYTGLKPAPIVAGFSSRGPSAVQPLILKVYKPHEMNIFHIASEKVSRMIYGEPIFKDHMKL